MKITGVNIKFVNATDEKKYQIVITGNLDSIQWIVKRFETDYRRIVCI